MTGTVADDDPIWRGGEESARSQGGANGAEPTTDGRGVSESDEILPANDRRPLQKSNQIIFFFEKNKK